MTPEEFYLLTTNLLAGQLGFIAGWFLFRELVGEITR